MGSSFLTCLTAAGAILAVHGLIDTAGPRADQTRFGYQEWKHAVESHRPGEADAAVSSIGPWPAKALDAVMDDLRKDPVAHVDDLAIRGAMLHADIAIFGHSGSGYRSDLPAARYSAMALRDGASQGSSAGTYHWTFARELLDQIPKESSRQSDVLHWYQATSALLVSWSEYAEVRQHLGYAIAIYPRDPELLVLAGAVHEAWAEARIQIPAQDAVAMHPAGTVTLPVQSASIEHGVAEAFFRRALEMAPGDIPEARLRLGRLLGLDGKHDEAAAEIERAARAPLPTQIQYYAALFAGREQAAMGHLEVAQESFERAAKLYPSAQSAALALSEVRTRMGDSAGAQRELLRPRPNAGAEDADPWWTYFTVHVPDALARLAEVRQAASRSH